MNINRLLIFLFVCLCAAPYFGIAQPKIITTYAGTGTGSYTGEGGPASAATLNQPNMINFDGAGNLLIADNGNARVRKINLATGIITLVAGGGSTGTGGDGLAATASGVQFGVGGGFNAGVAGVAVDAAGNIYITDGTNNKIRVVSASTGIISTFAGTGTAGALGDGGPASAAQLNSPRGIFIDAADNLYIADNTNNKIRMVVLSTGIITTIAGTGTAGSLGDGGAATAAQLNGPRGVCTDAAGNIYIADRSNNKVRKIDAATGIISTYAGTGTGAFSGDGGAAATAALSRPYDVKADASGNLYIADNNNTRVRMVTAAGTITTLAGTTGFGGAAGDGGLATASAVRVAPLSIAVIDSNHFFISDQTNNRIRYVKPNSRPYFTGGSSQALSVCMNSFGDSINALAVVFDSDRLQTLTWSVSTAPTHGSVAGAYTHASSGGAITPTGMFYSPTSGYSGSDVFVIQISDGISTSLDTINVTVNPLPVVAPISGPTSVCIGSTITLTDASPGGIWNVQNSNASVSGGVVTGLALGIDTIIYSVVNACGITNVTYVDTIIGAPAPITGTLTMCPGATSLLSDAGGGSWSSSNLSVATVGSSTGLVTGVTPGNATITYSLGGSCITTAIVTVSPLPAAITPAGSVTVCLGSTTPLADATPGGTWSSASPGIATVSGTGVVTGLATGPVNISYTSLAGCSVSKTVTVTITPAPLSPSSATVCPGSSTTFTESVSGGVWSSTAPAVGSVSGGVVTGISAGTTNISYTIGSCAVGAPVTVNAPPAAITPATAVSVCVGATTPLGDATPGGTWSSGSTGVATVSGSGVVTGVSAGLAIISYTNTLGCSVTKLVTVSNTPAPLTPVSATVCAGATTTFTDAVGGGVWSSSATGVASVTGGVVTGVSGGTATISYAIGTCIVTAPVTVNPLPSAGSITGPSSICSGTPVSYTDAVSGGVWSSSLPAVATVTGTGVLTGVTVGTTTLSYAVTNSCGTTVATLPVTVGLAPSAGTIIGTTLLCVGSSTMMVDTVAGGIWSSSNSHATISALGLMVAVSTGIDTISYSITNACGTVAATKVVTIGPSLTVGAISGPGGVCVGSAITLTEASTGGVWSASNASATVSGSGVVTGMTPGTDTIRYTYTSGCGSVSATHVVVVTPIPDAGTITGATLLCAGFTSVYTDAAPGGVWSCTNSNAVISSSGVLNAVNPGIDTIHYTVTNSCGTAVAAAYVTIGAALSAGSISGPGSVCVGSVITLTDAVSGGVWTSSNTTATVLGGNVTGITTGIDTISYTVTSSCGSASATAIIAVSPLPDAGVISGPSTLCIGAPVTYTNPAAGGVWSSSNPSVIISGSGFATPVVTGTDTISYTVTNTCGTALATAIVNVFNMPVAGSISGPAAVCAGSSITLTDAAPGGVWSASNSNAIVSGGVVTGITSGLDTISYTVTGACGSATAIQVISVDGAPSAGTISGPAAVCVGSMITLADGVAGGTWSAINANASVSGTGDVTGLAGGTDTIRYTVSNACGSAIASFGLTVSASVPVAGTITGPATVCAGAMITLTDAVPGGTWASSSSNATVAGGVVTGVTAGTATISYTVTNGCGSAVATTLITVGAALDAGIISGPLNVCAGGAITLTDAAPGGIWSSSNTTATVSGGVVTGVTPGIDTIYYTVSSGCGSASAMQVVTISLTPVAGIISGPSVVCVGGTIALTDATPGGIWAASNSRATVAGGIVSGITTGGDTISYTVTNGCGSAVATRVITVSTIPAAGSISGPSSLCPGAAISLSHLGSAGVWTSSNVGVASVSGAGLVTGVAAGSVTISYTVTNGCGHASATHAVAVLTPALCGTTEVNALPASGDDMVSVTPNPNNGTFSMLFSAAASQNVHVVITNLIGSRVKEFNTMSNQHIDVQLNEPAGIYLLTATTTSGRHVVRLVIN